MSEHIITRMRLGVIACMLCMLMPSALAGTTTDELRDPTRPPDVQGPTRAGEREPRWQIHSVLVAAERRLAIINGRRVRVGDSIDGATVLAIDAVAVELQHAGRTLRLPVPSHRQPVREQP
ncbi:MAG: hypothetical protein RQ729_09600 [Wenzhouxiangellaceae bacterium]|nr:hypothetical protein [Wenzhouxiangellaceae bacterium]